MKKLRKILIRIRSWFNGKPATWSNLSDSQRAAIMKGNRRKVKSAPTQVSQEDETFKDVFGSSPVNPASSAIGATVNQRGLGAIMSRRLFEPKQPPEDNN